MLTLLDALRAWERRRADLQAQLEHADGLSRAARPGTTTGFRAMLTARLADWSTLLRRHPAEARPILRQLVVGRLQLTP